MSSLIASKNMNTPVWWNATNDWCKVGIQDYTTMPTWEQFDLTRLVFWRFNWNALVTLVARAPFRANGL